jgi:hypothetical protein
LAFSSIAGGAKQGRETDMGFTDFLALAIRAISAQRLRSFLTLLGIAVGIAAVILLTSIGEGIHRYVLAEFTQFGTNVDRHPSGPHQDRRRHHRPAQQRAAAVAGRRRGDEAPAQRDRRDALGESATPRWRATAARGG